MNKDFEHIDRLIEEVKKDKAADGANSSNTESLSGTFCVI